MALSPRRTLPLNLKNSTANDQRRHHPIDHRCQRYYAQHRREVIHELLQDPPLIISFHSHIKQFYRVSKNKPLQTVLERFIQVQACKYVDEIIPYATEKELMDILTSYPIYVRIVGEEYRDKQFTGYQLPMSVYFNSRQHSFSTTELRQRLFDEVSE